MIPGRSISRGQEFDLRKQFRDLRTTSEAIVDFLRLPRVASILYALLAATCLIAPAMWPIVLVSWFALWITLMGYIPSLPFNAPFTASPHLDMSSPLPGRTGYAEANASFYLGNDMNTNEELYLSFDALLRHMMVFGTTGAGKTETMSSFASNFLATGSGFIFNDAKGTSNLTWLIYTMVRWFGRDDDFLTKNYITGNASEHGDYARRKTNDSAPFAFGSPEANTQLIISLMPSDKGGANKVFSEAAIALISSVMPALVELRDQGLLLIDPAVIRTYMEYGNCCKLLTNRNVSDRARQSITAFIKSRSGYDETKGYNSQPEEVRKQFGFAQAYFIRALNSLSDTYGYIFMTGAGEIDYRDVILQDRILVTLLPAMEKSGEELSNLGKISLSAIRNALASGLGTDIEGERETVLESLPTASKRPFGVFNDEYAFMMVDGGAVTNAQARGLNVALIVGAQDYAGLKRANEAEAEQTVSNSRFKYIMSLNDAGSTLDLVKRLAGEAYVSLTSGYKQKEGGLGLGYTDGTSASVQKVERINPDDLKSLNMGEGFGIYMDKIVLMKNFYHGFKASDLTESFHVRRRVLLNFRPTRGPMAEALKVDSRALRREMQIWFDNEERPVNASTLPVPELFSRALTLANESEGVENLNPTEKGLFTLGKLFEVAIGDDAGFGSDDDDDDADSGVINDGSNLIGHTSESILGTMSGTFGADDEPTEAEIQDVIDNVSAFMQSLEMSEDNPVAEPLTEGTALKAIEESNLQIDDEQADDGSMVNEDDQTSSVFTRAQQSAIAIGVTKMEIATGVDPKTARMAGKTTAAAVKKATEFPKNPRPNRTDANKSRLTMLVQEFISDPGTPEDKK